jgi:hypothetical protein
MGGCFPEMIGMIENHENHKFQKFFLPLKSKINSPRSRNAFFHLSYTPANRNECPYCKHLLANPTNTSIVSLSLKNHNFKLVTLTRAASQPVAL